MNITPTPLNIKSRVLNPPVLRYGPRSREPTIVSDRYNVDTWFYGVKIIFSGLGMVRGTCSYLFLSYLMSSDAN